MDTNPGVRQRHSTQVRVNSTNENTSNTDRAAASTGIFHFADWRQYVPTGDIHGDEGLIPTGEHSLLDKDNNVDMHGIQTILDRELRLPRIFEREQRPPLFMLNGEEPQLPAGGHTQLKRQLETHAVNIQGRNMALEDLLRAQQGLDRANEELAAAQAVLAAATKMSIAPSSQELTLLNQAVTNAMVEVGNKREETRAEQANYAAAQAAVVQGHRGLTLRGHGTVMLHQGGQDQNVRWQLNRAEQIGLATVGIMGMAVLGYYAASRAFEPDQSFINLLHEAIASNVEYLALDRADLERYVREGAPQGLIDATQAAIYQQQGEMDIRQGELDQRLGPQRNMSLGGAAAGALLGAVIAKLIDYMNRQ